MLLGALAVRHSHVLDVHPTPSVGEEIEILQTLHDADGWLYLEFDVPRLGSRIDVILIAGPAIFPVEFKCGDAILIELEMRGHRVQLSPDYCNHRPPVDVAQRPIKDQYHRRPNGRNCT